jgi:hypothetical protein
MEVGVTVFDSIEQSTVADEQTRQQRLFVKEWGSKMIVSICYDGWQWTERMGEVQGSAG